MSEQNTRITIRDKNNAEYILSCGIDEVLWRLNLHFGRTQVGYVNAMPEGDTLLLRDICLYREVIFHESEWIRLARKMLRRPQRPTDFRFRGLGGVLITHVLSLARHHGFSRISGEIKEHDFHRDAWLPDWYRARGFKVEETGVPSEPFTLTYEL